MLQKVTLRSLHKHGNAPVWQVQKLIDLSDIRVPPHKHDGVLPFQVCAAKCFRRWACFQRLRATTIRVRLAVGHFHGKARTMPAAKEDSRRGHGQALTLPRRPLTRWKAPPAPMLLRPGPAGSLSWSSFCVLASVFRDSAHLRFFFLFAAQFSCWASLVYFFLKSSRFFLRWQASAKRGLALARVQQKQTTLSCTTVLTCATPFFGALRASSPPKVAVKRLQRPYLRPAAAEPRHACNDKPLKHKLLNFC